MTVILFVGREHKKNRLTGCHGQVDNREKRDQTDGALADPPQDGMFGEEGALRNSGRSAAVCSTFRLANQRFLVIENGECAGLSLDVVGQFTHEGRTLLIASPRPQAKGPERDPIELLTPRELQIATLVAQGFPTKRIADKLRISDWTVATHLRRVFAKLNVDNRAAMVFQCASLIGDACENHMAQFLDNEAGKLNSQQRRRSIRA